MTTGHVFIAQSLDGFIARPDGTLDWLMKQGAPGEDTGFEAFMASVDGLIMGRGTFEVVAGFDSWPCAKPVVVLSRSMTEEDIRADLRDKVTLSRQSPTALMASLGWARAYVDGGQVIQSFLREGLVEDLAVTVVPILLGQGRPLFGALPEDIALDLVSTREFASGLVTLTYRVRRDPLES